MPWLLRGDKIPFRQQPEQRKKCNRDFKDNTA
jgi:hypothetical protein